MPDVRRRDLGDAMGQAVAGIAGGLANGGSTAITQVREITSTDGRQGRPSTSGAGLAFGTTRTANIAKEFTETLESGVWLVDAVAAAEWTGAVGIIEAEIVNHDNEAVSGIHRTIDTVEMDLFIPSYRYVSSGGPADRLTVSVVQIGGGSAAFDWNLTATYLGFVE